MKKLSAMFLILALALGQTACSDSDYRKAARAGAGIASGLQALQGINEEAYDAKLIAPDETIALAQYISDATRANDEFVKQLGGFKQLKPGDRAALAIWFGGLTRSLDTLNQQGILRVKNPEARARLAAAFAAVQASAQILASLFAAYAPEALPSNVITCPPNALCATAGAARVRFHLSTCAGELPMVNGFRIVGSRAVLVECAMPEPAGYTLELYGRDGRLIRPPARYEIVAEVREVRPQGGQQ